MGKVLGIIAAIVVVVVLLIVFGIIDIDGDVEGGSMPEVEVETRGEFEAPDVDMDVEGPDVNVDGGRLPEVEVEGGQMPSVDVEPADEADAAAEDDDPNL